MGGFLLWIQTILSKLERERNIEPAIARHSLFVTTTEFSDEE